MLDQVDDSGVRNVIAIVTLNGPENTEVNFFVKRSQFVVSNSTKCYLNCHEKNETKDALKTEILTLTWSLILIEKGYIPNREEEDFLWQPQYIQ